MVKHTSTLTFKLLLSIRRGYLHTQCLFNTWAMIERYDLTLLILQDGGTGADLSPKAV